MPPINPSGGKSSPPPPDAMDMDEGYYGEDDAIPGDQAPENLPKGKTSNVPSGSRAALVAQAMAAANMGSPYVEFMMPDGTWVWFSTAEVVNAFGTQSQQQMMAKMGSAPSQQQYNYQGQGGNNSGRMYMTGPGGGNQGGYMEMGGPGGGYPYGGGYGGGWGGGGLGGYGSGPLYDMMFGGAQRDEMYAMRRQIRKTEHQMRYKMRMIMFMILMGDVTGAMRAMIFESERMNRMFNRTLVKQLNRVREAKAKILKAMGSKRPPRAHDNTNDPAGAARDQNRQAKYTQWVSVTTQLMSEVQQTERELLDLLSEGRRNINELWEAYSGLKEAEARTTRTLIQGFRG